MLTSSESSMSQVRKGHSFNEKLLEDYLVKEIQGFARGMIVKQFTSGQSNPSFFIRDGNENEFVLRKKPPGKLLPSAHMIEREYEVITALENEGFPVPHVYLYCKNRSIIGTEFYVMKFIRGRIFRDNSLPGISKQERDQIFDEMNRVLAKLHSIDYRKAGLENFGKGAGYYERQIHTWTRQYTSSSTDDIADMNRIMEWLPKNIPKQHQSIVSIVHGDYRIENVIFHPTEPTILAVLDWELATLGHPFSDLAYFSMLWNLPPPFGIVGVDNCEGIPTEQENVAKYCRRIAGIAQGVYKRSLQGNASAPNAKDYGMAVYVLADRGCQLIDASEAQVKARL